MTTLPSMPDWLLPFLVTAAGLAAAFSASLVWAAGRAPVPRWRTALLWAGAPLALVTLYATLGHPRALDALERQPGQAEQVEAMVTRLAERLRQNPVDPDGWLMLARSYKVMGRHEEAAQAYEQAGDRAMADADLLADWIEARVLARDQHFDERSRTLLARAMSLAPAHPGVLMMRGLAALDRGDRAAARDSFVQLRALFPEGSPDRAALDDALARLDRGQDPRRGETAGTADR
ncbi:tetratricopeptide repeat protein [Sphaerotilus hippei]|uniref:Tetratricopeptide repeat protein n=1 Tax=Sphaerotilus hippei TaxID=744406 RepID=A0A318GXV9_9BURK|nr:tetratricopeptide repeat protein [Sphaerotilus hippei]PXW93380.1 tetratricopeptide repeat protein [Sphaerotilus hippei]